ncbi:MAG: acetate--CoA ligase family protein [Candidatus Thermoplasmatota archaeon]|nr:acetate--CoA ligase family protein [Candidatus Thermoplasmatota archaeon]
MTQTDLQYLFDPRHVAIVGASHTEGKIGYIILNNIIESGYRGRIYPVNPRGGEILGHRVYADIGDVEGEVDLALVVVPASIAVQAVEACARKGVKFAVVITSGFSEIGNIDAEREMVETARKHGMRILGPNVFGLYSAAASINATFGPGNIRPGNIAVISQSGALGIAMIGKTAEENMGLSTIVSIGNKADITEAELLQHLFTDDITDVIFLYIEGLENGREFMDLVKQKPRDMQVLAIKAGKSEVGARAVASHTGSLAGSDKIFDAAFKQAGVLRAETIQEGFNWVTTLAACPEPQGKNVVIITNGGGIGVLAADACEKYGIDLTSDMEMLKKTFQPVVPRFGSYRNPVDLTGQAGGDDYREALERALNEDSIHAVIALYCQAGMTSLQPLKQTIMEIQEQYGDKKPIIYSLFGGEETEAVLDDLTRSGIPAFADVQDAVSALNALYRAYEQRQLQEQEEVDIDEEAIRALLRQVADEGRTQLLGTEAKAVMQAAGLDVPPFRVVRDIEGAIAAAEEIGYPVVMKVVSEDIVHKTDMGGVLLDLDDKNEVMEGYEAIIRNCRKQAPHANIRGVEITKMVDRGVETIIGATTDPSFDKVLMFGLGGIYVEVLKDVAFRVAPVSRREIGKMMREISSFPLLLGVRGESRKDVNAVIDAIYRVGILVDRFPQISELDVNPLVVYEKGAKVLDARINIEVEK